jgi:hypothetical protein
MIIYPVTGRNTWQTVCRQVANNTSGESRVEEQTDAPRLLSEPRTAKPMVSRLEWEGRASRQGQHTGDRLQISKKSIGQENNPRT